MNYSTASIDDLYKELSLEAGAALGLSDGTPEDGRKLFERIWQRVSDNVCGNQVVRDLVEDREAVAGDEIAFAAILATQFTAAVGNIFNVLLLVAIATRLGVKVLCADHWADTKP